MDMEVEHRNAIPPQPPYPPQIPPIQAQYDPQPRYPTTMAPTSTYQAIQPQPQPSRPEYTTQSGYSYPQPGASSSTFARFEQHPGYTQSPQTANVPYTSETATMSRPPFSLPPLDASSSQNTGWHNPAPYASSSNYVGFQTDQYPSDPRGKSHTGDYERKEGTPNYPPKAPSRGPKQRFTPEDDDLLRRLKEDYQNPRLSWKQIADFFPDRNSGTLQVRYCTKLKRKDEIKWTDEADRKLQKLYKDDQSNVWKRLAQKMGTGASDIHCQERFEYLEAEQMKKGGVSDGDDLGSQRG